MGSDSVLDFLVIENFPAAVSFCLLHGFDANRAESEMGTTPLHYACKLDYFDVARALLEHGADPNAICQTDDTPIHCAVKNGNAELVDALIQRGGDPNYVTGLGETIFDNWPPWAEAPLAAVIKKHQVTQTPT